MKMNNIYIVDFCDCENESWGGVAYATIELAKAKAKEFAEKVFEGKESRISESGYTTRTFHKKDLFKEINNYEPKLIKECEDTYAYFFYGIGVAIRIGEFPFISE